MIRQERSKQLRRIVYEIDETMKVAVTITSGEKTDGKELPELVRKSRDAGMEAKNSELKHRPGYDVASSSGLISMEMQGAMTIFAVNLKRIIKLIREK